MTTSIKKRNRMRVGVLLKAIRQHCLACSGNERKEVDLCPIEDCPLWPYRFGVSPSTAEKRGKRVVPNAKDE